MIMFILMVALGVVLKLAFDASSSPPPEKPKRAPPRIYG